MSESEYWKKFMAKRLSRRAAIKSGAMAGAGLVLGSAIGCGSNQSPTATVASGAKPGATNAATAAATAVATKGPKTGGTLNLTYNQDPPTLDPHITASYATIGMISPVYNRLFKYKTGPDADPQSFDIIPDLAESVEKPDDLTYIFKLRQGVKYHNKPPVNGRELTSEDIKYSLQRLGTDKPEYQAKYMVSGIDKIETPDKYTVKVVMKEPVAAFLKFMGGHFPWILPKEVADKEGEAAKTAIGTGPFMLDSYERNVKAVFKKNPDYFIKGKPYVDEIVYNIMPDVTNRIAAFRTKQIIELGQQSGLDGQSADDIKKSTPGIGSETTYGFSTMGLMVPRDVKPLNDLKVRQALSLALDRKAIIDTIGNGNGKLTGAVPPSLKGWGLDEDQLRPYYQRDVAKAKSLLTEAGYPNGFKIEVLTTGAYGPAFANGAVLVKDQLKDIGVDVSIRTAEYAAFLKEYMGPTYEGLSLHYQTPWTEADEWLSSLYHSKGSRNARHLADDKLDAMVEKQRRTMDEAERKKQVVEIQKYILDNVYFIGLAVWSQFVVWHPNLLGYRPHAFGGYALHLYQDVSLA